MNGTLLYSYYLGSTANVVQIVPFQGQLFVLDSSNTITMFSTNGTVLNTNSYNATILNIAIASPNINKFYNSYNFVD